MQVQETLHGTEATPTLHQEEPWAVLLDQAAGTALRHQMTPVGL